MACRSAAYHALTTTRRPERQGWGCRATPSGTSRPRARPTRRWATNPSSRSARGPSTLTLTQKWGSETNLDPREAGPNSRPLAFRRSNEGIPHDQQGRLGGWPLDERARFRRPDGRGNRVPLFDATGPSRRQAWLRTGARAGPALRRDVPPATAVD